MASVASTYARAFADVVLSAHLDASRAVAGLREIARLLDESAPLRRVWENPAVPADQKRKLLDAIVQREGIDKPVRNLVAVLIDHRRVHFLSRIIEQLEKELETQKRKGALSNLDDLAARAQTIKGTKLVSEEVGNVDREGLRQLVDSLRQKLGSGVVVLGMPEDGKVVLIAGVTKDLTAKVHAGKLIQVLAPKVGGKGGGRPDLAEAGGKDTSGLKSALQSVPSLLEPLL